MAMANMGTMTDLYPRANHLLQHRSYKNLSLPSLDCNGYEDYNYKLMGTIHTNIHKSTSSMRRCTMHNEKFLILEIC